MASDDRFYLMEFKNRPVLHGDIGSLLRLEGVVVGGGGTRTVLMLPDSPEAEWEDFQHPSLEEWSDWLQRSDSPEILVGPAVNGSASLPKVWHRKLRYEISGAVQQKIWAADQFACVYCHRKMGEVLMTIDHFTPLELGGANDVSNFLSACKPCNKAKGSMDPEVWCRDRKLNPASYYRLYLKSRKI